jgi:hypothetical protein
MVGRAIGCLSKRGPHTITVEHVENEHLPDDPPIQNGSR